MLRTASLAEHRNTVKAGRRPRSQPEERCGSLQREGLQEAGKGRGRKLNSRVWGHSGLQRVSSAWKMLARLVCVCF